MADEVKDRKAADAEAQAEAKAVDAANKDAEKVVEARASEREVESGPRFLNTVQVTEDDFPSAKSPKVPLLSSPVDANEGWTVQSEVGYVDATSLPGQYVQKSELPTKEGLAAHGIDPVPYVAGVPVRA